MSRDFYKFDGNMIFLVQCYLASDNKSKRFNIFSQALHILLDYRLIGNVIVCQVVHVKKYMYISNGIFSAIFNNVRTKQE